MKKHTRITPTDFCLKLATILFVVGSSLTASQPILAQGLVLEEIIVTAQRREQNLQEVPISINVYSGEEISLQGYRNIEDLAKFSPSVQVMDRSNRVNTTVRGFGTVAGSSQTLVSAAPFFLDGIHLGATEMAKMAFLDTQRVEVLKGPQPLHFGMNAIAGAFNIISRRPTPEWEGEATVELGNDGRKELNGAFGGPLTQTLGIRLSGIYEQGNGPLRNMVGGDKYGGYDTLGGRILLQWTPNDQLDVVTKFEIARMRDDNDIDTGCLTDGELKGFPESSPLDGGVVEGVDFGNERSVLAGPPKGVSTSEGLGLAWYPEDEEGQDCFDNKFGMSRGGPYLEPPGNVVQENQRDLFDGMIDARVAANAIMNRNLPQGPDRLGTPNGGLDGQDDIDMWNALVDITYVLDNGMSVNSQTGLISFEHFSNEENCQCPFFTNQDGRGMDLNQFSQNLRVQSRPEGYDLNFAGGMNLEFMFGASYQQWQKDLYDNPVRANLRRAQRFNKSWEDARWISGFWELTFNFMDNQLSISAGGRYTDISKDTFLRGSGSQWIFDEIPCDSDGVDDDPATCTADPDFKWVNPDLNTFTSFDASNTDQTVSDFEEISTVRVDSPLLLLNTVDTANLWAAAKWSDTTAVPLNWRSPGGAIPVGLTAPVYNSNVRSGPWGDCAGCLADPQLEASDYNNQFVISFTPNALQGAHTFYAKYAEAFKGPVSDTAQATIPGSLDDMVFLPEYITAYEVGARGNLFDNRVRYDISAFINDFKDVQLGAAATQNDPLEQSSVQLNAAKQEVDGIEFSLTALVTENLTLSVAGALMDGKMAELDGGGCSEDELIAAAVDALGDGGQSGRTYTADEVDTAEGLLDDMGPTRSAELLSRAGSLPSEFFINGGCRLSSETGPNGVEFGDETINRSGEKAAYTPDWKFVFGLDYRLPVLDTYEVFFNAKGFISDGWLMSSEIFDRTIKYDSGHGDVNLTAGFGPRDGTWRISGYARNILEVKPSFHQEYELELEGFITAGHESEVRGLGDSAFMSYGVRLEYLF